MKELQYEMHMAIFYKLPEKEAYYRLKGRDRHHSHITNILKDAMRSAFIVGEL